MELKTYLTVVILFYYELCDKTMVCMHFSCLLEEQSASFCIKIKRRKLFHGGVQNQPFIDAIVLMYNGHRLFNRVGLHGTGVNHILNLMYWMCCVAAVVARDEYKFMRFCDTGGDIEIDGPDIHTAFL